MLALHEIYADKNFKTFDAGNRSYFFPKFKLTLGIVTYG